MIEKSIDSNELSELLSKLSINESSLNSGLILAGQNKDKILEFINVNTKNDFEINEIGKLNKKTTTEKSFLAIELQTQLNKNSNIIITMSNDNYEIDDSKHVEVNLFENNRIVILNKKYYDVDNIVRDDALEDYLTKSLFTHLSIMPLSSTAITAVIGSASDVYHGPDYADYATAGSISQGENPVYILAKSKGWYHIEYLVTSTGKHKTGYIPASVVTSYSGGEPTEEDFYGGYCYASTELDVRTCDDFSLTAPVGTLFKHEGCTFLFSYIFNGENIAFIEYSTSSGAKRGYVYSKYLIFPFETIVCIVKEAINVYGGPGNNYSIIGALGAGELVSLLAKESNWIYVEYNTTGGRKRGYITWDKVDPRDYTPGTLFPDFYPNGVSAYIVDEHVIVYGGPNSNYAQLGSVRNEEVTCYNTNKGSSDTYTFEYTCIEYTVSATGQRKRGYVLASKVINGNLPEENNALESFDNSYPHFGSKISYGQTQKGRNMFYYRFGSGDNHLFLTFALHGWEDGTKADGTYYHGDGNMLLKVAKRFMQKFTTLSTSRLDELKSKWSIFVFPGINLDGIVNGNNNNGFGRCLYNKLDPNRNWAGDFEPNVSSPRYKTASIPFQGLELSNLKKALRDNRGSAKNVLIDVHGWFNQTVGNSNIGQYYWNSMGIPSSRHSYSYGRGYLVAWAKNSPNLTTNENAINQAGLGADSCLLELTPTTDYSDSKMQSYGDQFFNGTINILDDIGQSVGPVIVEDVNLPSNKRASLKSEIVSYVSDNIGLAGLKAVRSREQAAEDTLSYDSKFTELSNRFGMRKALIQTVSMWERACEGHEDSLANTMVENDILYHEQVEYWYNLPSNEQMLTPYPSRLIPWKEDCSTGFSQIFANTAINARNWAREQGLISDREYNFENWKDRKEIWEKLKNDVNFNLETCALVLLWGASDVGLDRVNPYNYSQDQIKQVLKRYNGFGDKAEDYGNKNLGLYNIFEKYNSEAR